MTDVTIREATREDAEAIREVHRASILELGLEGYDQRQVEAWAAGCDSADYTEPIDAEVTGVYVHPAVFRQGVGSQLYATLERAARERGMECGDAERPLVTCRSAVIQSQYRYWSSPSRISMSTSSRSPTRWTEPPLSTS